MKPVVFYVDDEPHNLTVLEASLPESWNIFTFDNPMEALKQLEIKKPWVILSDQRMPSISGVEFLELTMKMNPRAIRIIVTGYSDENLVVESVRKAQIFDYIRKPWDPTDLEQSIQRAIDLYSANEKATQLHQELLEREKQLSVKNTELMELTKKLEATSNSEKNLREELECWVPPFVLWALKDNSIKFPIKKDIVGITFDIVDSSNIHETYVDGQPIRTLIIKLFSETIIKYGGWRESHSGDSAYGHFGLLDDKKNPCDSALAVARDFRVGLRSLCSIHNVNVECGIALHIVKNSIVDVHKIQLNTTKGIVTQKSFDTTSLEIDLLHRMEKLVHKLPGSNIIMSKEFYSQLTDKPNNITEIGNFKLKGQKKETPLLLICSDKVNKKTIDEAFKNTLNQDTKKNVA